jgi:hypothetical protein
MAAARKTNPETDSPRPRRPPAKTIDARENQLVALAVDLAEKQIRDGTASAQVITHFLRLGTTRERLEQEKLQLEKALLSSRADQIASQASTEKLYKDALRAMRSYSGGETEEEDDDDDD